MTCFLRFVFFALFLGAFSSPVSAQSTVHCDLCRDRITGTYSVYEGKFGVKTEVCRTCMTNKAKCSLCNIPHNNHSHNGQSLCNNCKSDAKHCSMCTDLLTGRFVEYDLGTGRPYRACQTCAQSNPKCDSCAVPFRPNFLKGFDVSKTQWCKGCLHKADYCETCREPISGKFYTMEFREGQWCGTCFESRSKCQVCQVPMGDIAARLGDGREICSACFSSAVTGQQRISAIADVVQTSIVELLGKEFDRIPVRAVPMNVLQDKLNEFSYVSKQKDPNPDNFVRELGVFTVSGRKTEILVLDALPEDLAWQTIAHEMAHAWQHQHYPMASELVIVEGFAQWVAEQIAHKHFKRTGLEKLRNRRDLYGRGFRVMTRLEDRGGKELVLKALEQNALPQ